MAGSSRLSAAGECIGFREEWARKDGVTSSSGIGAVSSDVSRRKFASRLIRSKTDSMIRHCDFISHFAAGFEALLSWNVSKTLEPVEY